MMSNVVVVLALSFLLVLPSAAVFAASRSAPTSRNLGHADECDALLQFKSSLTVNYGIVSQQLCQESRFNVTSAPKTTSWKEGTDCCTWEGITCDNVSRKIIQLDLTCSYLQGTLHSNSSLFSSLRHLWGIYLGGNHLTGPIPSSLCQKGSLQFLDLSDNDLIGTMPLCLGNLSSLNTLYLSYNRLEGPLPRTLVNCTSLEDLAISYNQINDTFPFWLKSLPLHRLQLAGNNFHGFIASGHAALPFPYLELLFIGHNHFHGQLPQEYFQLSNLTYIDLSGNMCRGSLPVPPVTSEAYFVHDNIFTGNIPSSFCNITTLSLISMSKNSLSGAIPHCLISVNTNLQLLDLSMNRFRGPIPEILAPNHCSLKSIVLSHIHLGGKLPRSWTSCKQLEVLDISDNEEEDSFPSWLEALPDLYGLVIRSNKFHEPITSPKAPHPFRRLHIFDISNNNFSGLFPTKYIANFNDMMGGDKGRGILQYGNNGWSVFQSASVIFKGVQVKLQGIEKALVVIDLSRNHFQGEVIGNLQSLRGLNLSHNNFRGVIPSSLGNLTYLEWLDLSSNNFTREIPTTWTNLASLAILNVSMNRLTGQIPQGTQFATFGTASFWGNPDLCGHPLLKPCIEGHQPEPPSASQDEEHSERWIEWEAVLMGYGSGTVIGFSIGYVFIQIRRPPAWLINMVERKRIQNVKRPRRCSLAGHKR